MLKKNEDATRALSECASVEAKGETKAVTASSNAIDLQSLEGVQDINYDLELDIKNFTLCEVVWSDADRINRHGHIKVNLRVTPFHAFDIPKNGNFAGDYYFVQATVVSHNGDFYGIYSCSHGWVDTFAHALFCRRINFTAQLCNSYKEPYDSNLSFFQTPNPQTSANSVSYSSGFNFTLSVTGTGGYTQKPGWNLGGSFGGNWTWSDNKNETVSDQSIDMRTEEKTCKVNYTFWCNNWKEDDDQEIAIPRIARTDQTCKASWCWHREKVSDAVSIHTIPWAEWLHFTLRPTFAWIWRHKTWRCEGDYNEYTFKGLDEWAMLNPPDRVQYGTLSIQNNHTDDKVVTDLRIYYGDYKDGVYISLNDVLAKDATLNLTVPQGNYVIYYKVVDRNDIFNEPKWYRFDMVWVNPAEVCSVNTLHHLYEEIPPCER